MSFESESAWFTVERPVVQWWTSKEAVLCVIDDLYATSGLKVIRQDPAYPRRKKIVDVKMGKESRENVVQEVIRGGIV